MTTTAQRPMTRPRPARSFPLLARAVAAGCSTLLVTAALAGPAAATLNSPTAESPSPSRSATPSGSASPAPSAAAANKPPQLMECGGLMTQAGATESIRVSLVDPDGDPVTLSARISMFGVQPTVSGHVITYAAPTGVTGQDNFVVLASDGRGGESHCEIGVLIQAGSDGPTSTPAPTTPAPSPSTPAPGPTTEAPTPTPAPEPPSDTPAPGGAPTPGPTSAPPSPAPTTAPAAPGRPSTDGTVPGSTSPGPSTGGGKGSGTQTPGGSTDGSGSAGGTDDAGGPSAGGPDAGTPAAGTGGAGDPGDGSVIALRPRPVPGAGTVSPWADAIPTALGAGSLRTLANAQELLQDLDSGLADGNGDGIGEPSEAGDPDNAQPSEESSPEPEAGDARADQLARTGSSGWLFGGVGALMIALVGLALMALPRGRRRH